MGNVPVAVPKGTWRTTGATAAFAAMERPSPVSKIPVLAGVTRTFWADAGASKPYTLAGVRCFRRPLLADAV